MELGREMLWFRILFKFNLDRQDTNSVVDFQEFDRKIILGALLRALDLRSKGLEILRSSAKRFLTKRLLLSLAEAYNFKAKWLG